METFDLSSAAVSEPTVSGRSCDVVLFGVAPVAAVVWHFVERGILGEGEFIKPTKQHTVNPSKTVLLSSVWVISHCCADSAP